MLMELSPFTTAILGTIKSTSLRLVFTLSNYKSCKRLPSTEALPSQQILTRVHTHLVTLIIISTSKAAPLLPPPTAHRASATIRSPKCVHFACPGTYWSTEHVTLILVVLIGSIITMEPATQLVLDAEIMIGLQDIASPAPTPIIRWSMAHVCRILWSAGRDSGGATILALMWQQIALPSTQIMGNA